MAGMELANQIVILVTGILGLIGTGVGVFFAVKNFITSLRGKNAKEVWALIQNIADAAMKEAEATGKKGEDKKAQVIEAVKAGCKAASINADEFMDQLSDYIDQAITFANSIKNAKK